MNHKQLLDYVYTKAKEKKCRVLVCEGWDEHCLKASCQLQAEGVAQLVLLGDEQVIAQKAKEWQLGITGIEILNHKTSEKREALANALYELRKIKGMTPEEAHKLLDDVNYFGAMLVQTGYVDGMAGSGICPTGELMKPALQIIKTKEGRSLVSEAQVFYDPKRDKMFFLSDSSLNIEPTPEQLATIALNAADCAKSFGITPKVALLSFSTKGSGNSPVYKPILEALEIARKMDTSLLIDGEMQVDAAMNPNSCKRKCPDCLLQGDANVLITPNLSVGNVLVHALLQFSELKFLFGIAMGMKKPVTILGRGTSLDMVKNLIALTAFEANEL